MCVKMTGCMLSMTGEAIFQNYGYFKYFCPLGKSKQKNIQIFSDIWNKLISAGPISFL